MREDARQARRREIEAATLGLLIERGVAGTTMQAIAKEANASIETLYKWYGDRAGLIRAMVISNTAELRSKLDENGEIPGTPIQKLEWLAPRLLTLVVSDRLVALNRVAAGDEELGRIIAEAGRDTVAPLIVRVFSEAAQVGDLEIPSPELATDIFLGLLIGDLQIRRVVGRLPLLPAEEVDARVGRSLDIIYRLWGTDQRHRSHDPHASV